MQYEWKEAPCDIGQSEPAPTRTPSNGGMTITRTPLWMNLKPS
jgi:hypothetical protein